LVCSGNNVISFKSTPSAPSTQSSAGLNFNRVYTDAQDPTTASNIDAAKTNAFYVINSMHDFAYRYGFTEQAFNFQESNFGQGGREGDGVLMSVQDASGVNNANFATPPE
jgi:extracellular elastinolytic metalloproteinase